MKVETPTRSLLWWVIAAIIAAIIYSNAKQYLVARLSLLQNQEDQQVIGENPRLETTP